MALTYLDTEFESDSEEEHEVFAKLSYSDLITFFQDLILIGRCQEKSRHMKILKKQYVLLKDELKTY